MKKNYLFSLLTVTFCLGLSCSLWESGLPEQIIAQVNDAKISVDEFNKEFKELILSYGREIKNTNFGPLKEAFLDQIIERKLLVQEARKLNLKVSQEELNRAITEIKKDYPGEGFREKLGLKGMNLEEWKIRLDEKLLAEKMIRSAHYYSGKIEEKEIKQYYETHRSSFQIPQKVRVRQIVVAEVEEAIQILKRLKRGEDFTKLAITKSLGPERVHGGDLGYFSKGEKPSEFDHVFSMDVGKISDVIKSPYGYHIFKLEEKIEPREISFEEAKPRIIQELEQKKREEEYQKWLKILKAKSKIKINKKWLRS